MRAASRVTVITGGPGTGKTTLLRSLLVALADGGSEADAGRSDRTRRATAPGGLGREAKTIHRLLEYSPETGGFLRGKNFPLRTNILIVDEASMMDVELAASLLSALMPGARCCWSATRSVAVGRPRQRAQGCHRVRTWCRWWSCERFIGRRARA